MAKRTRALSGAAKDAYLRRTIRDETEIPEPARDRLIDRMRGEIASVSLRPAVVAPVETVTPACDSTDEGDAEAAALAAPAFDPFSPNVIVVIRTRGRQAVLEQLESIDDVDKLRLLAREQQLGVAQDIGNIEALREAIVAAAERRIANRRAAAS